MSTESTDAKNSGTTSPTIAANETASTNEPIRIAALKPETGLKATAATKPAPLADETATLPAAAKAIPNDQRATRFALLAASVAFAGALGAMAGALGTQVIGTQVIAKPGAAIGGDAPLTVIDLTAVRDSIASLRTEISAIKSSVDNSNRTANAQFATFNERLERIDRAQTVSAAPAAAQPAEKRAPAPRTTGTIRPQQAAAIGSAASGLTADDAASSTTATGSIDNNRERIINGWVVRRAANGVALIQGGRNGAFEVQQGDVVPGVGRIEAIRRQDGRWIVITSNGIIQSPTVTPR